MAFNETIKRAANIVHSVLGASLTYHKFGGDTIPNISIILDKNKSFNNDFGVIAGYRVEASFLKSDIEKVTIQDEFVELDGGTWRITQVIKETTAKWYVDVVRV